MNEKEETQYRPVFVLGGGQRTGSSLVQRLLLSTGEVMIWGEHGGLLVEHLQNAFEGMHEWNGHEGKGQLEIFRAKGFNNWIPNVNPAERSFLSASQAYLLRALWEPARRLGFQRWGFKEVRYGTRAVRFLNRLFPEAVFVFVVRGPKECLLSYKATDWGSRLVNEDPRKFLLEWATLTSELAECSANLSNSVLLRYEDLVSNPEDAMSRLASAAAIPKVAFKISEVLGKVLRGAREKMANLTEAEVAALGEARVKRAIELLPGS